MRPAPGSTSGRRWPPSGTGPVPTRKDDRPLAR
jgi:hypothetical protein